MFSPNVRAGHEMLALRQIDAFLNWHEGRLSERELREWIRNRDRQLALEIDSSWFHVQILEILRNEFPDARFVLTIRDCYSWLNSEFKRVLRAANRKLQRVRLRKLLYDPGNVVHAPEEQILKAFGIFPLDAYLSRWAAHNAKVLAEIPPERLLVVRTDQIRERACDIADFAGLPRYALRLNRTHAFQNPIQRELVRELDRNFVERKVEQHCRPLMNRFFPEIKTLDDAKL